MEEHIRGDALLLSVCVYVATWKASPMCVYVYVYVCMYVCVYVCSNMEIYSSLEGDLSLHPFV